VSLWGERRGKTGTSLQFRMETFLEHGTKRVFASGIEWPGWCRSAKTDEAALDALVAYAPRYAKVLARRKLGFEPPRDGASLRVRERLTGNATTDFGAPAIPPAADGRPFDPADAERLVAILEACWRALDRAAAAARGRVLTKGPRGGGRDLEKIVAHVADAEGGYLYALGPRPPKGSDLRRTIVEVLAARARGEAPERVPRKGKLWSPRYFVRRTAWHALDHAWEIEDRLQPKA
jgi:hypothetical protein